MKQIMRLLVIGISTSLVLGALLKWIQSLTGKKVYVLLLNVDYLPVINDIQMSEFVEFLLHVFVSIILVCMLYFGLKQVDHHTSISYYLGINGLIGVLLYITTAFSERTPALLDITSFIYWVIAHLIYGVVVGLCITFTET